MDGMVRRLVLLMLALALAAPTAVFAGGYYSVGAYPAVVPTLDGVSDVAVSSVGEAYVADSENGRIVVYSSAGEALREWDGSASGGPELIQPEGIALDAAGNVYVADFGGNRVAVYSASGEYLRSWGSAGSALGQFNQPMDVAVVGGDVWVADTGNSRIQQFRTDGTPVKQVGAGYGPENGQLKWPCSLAVGGGLVYVADTDNQRIAVFNATTGAWVRNWGPTGGTLTTPNVSRYLWPEGIVLDGAGSAYITDKNGGWVEKTAVADGSVSTGGPWAVPGTGWDGLITDPERLALFGNRLYIADSVNDRIVRFDLASFTWLAPWNRSKTSASGEFLLPVAAADLGDGRVVVADTGNNRVQIIDPSGTTPPQLLAGPFSAPSGVVCSADEVFVADTGYNRIQVYGKDGTFRRSIGTMGAGILQFLSPSGLALDGGGYLLIADAGNNRIQRIDAAGAGMWIESLYGLTSPGAVAFAHGDRSVWVADTGANRIVRFAPGQSVGTPYGSLGAAAGAFNSPKGIAVDPVSGEVVVTDSGNQRIQVFTGGGTWVRSMGERGTSPVEINSPGGIAVAASGQWLLADTYNHRIQRLSWDAVVPSVTITHVIQPDNNARVEIGAQDGGSGVDRIEYAINGGAVQRYSAPFVVTTQGAIDIRCWAFDRVGNKSAVGVRKFAIDSRPPVGTMTLAGGAAWTDATSVRVGSSVADELPSLSPIEMRIDTGAGFSELWLDYAPLVDVDLPGEGLHTVKTQYRDVNHNVLALEDTVSVDLQAPSAALSGFTDSVITSQSVSVGLDASDALSGVASRYLSLDGAPEQPYFAPITVSAEGAHPVSARAVDAAGNQAATSGTFVIDKTAPVCVLTGAPEGANLATNPLITLAVTDLHGAFVEYRVDGDVTALYSGPFIVAGDTSHVVEYRATDVAGNSTGWLTRSFNVDTIRPTGTMNLAGGADWVDTLTVHVNSSVTDASTPSSNIQMHVAVDGAGFGPWMPYDPSVLVTFSGEGLHTVKVEYRDFDQYVLSLEDTIGVDMQAPTVALSGFADSVITSQSISVGLVAADALSGVASRYLSIDGAPEQPYSAPVTISAEGTHTASVRVADAAGNQAATSGTFVVDKTGPAIYDLKLMPLEIRPDAPGSVSIASQWVIDGQPARTTVEFDGHSTPVTSEGSVLEWAGPAPHAFHLTTVDRIGNATAWPLSVDLFSVTAPEVRMVRARDRVFAVKAPGTELQPGERAYARYFRLDPASEQWRLARTTRMWSTPALTTGAARLEPGRYRAAYDVSSVAGYRFSQPSAEFIVR